MYHEYRLNGMEGTTADHRLEFPEVEDKDSSIAPTPPSAQQELMFPANRETALEFEKLVTMGELIRLDDSAEASDGSVYPVYREPTDQEREAFRLATIQAALDELEREGILVKTGEFRRNGKGILEPTYVHKDFAPKPNGNTADQRAGDTAGMEEK